MYKYSCQVALGTDGASTNDTVNMHEGMALALLMQRIATDVKWIDRPSAADS